MTPPAPTERWRLLRDGAASGVRNMALDEALLIERRSGDAPTLRLYSWAEPTISLGRFQSASELEPARAAGGFAMVRRITSGGAILHRPEELTYALIAPYRLFGGRDPRLAYQRVHGVIAAALASLGVRAERRAVEAEQASAPFCFDRVTDLDLVTGAEGEAAKLVGSAQRRLGAAFLQHGSIPRADGGEVRRATSLARLLGRVPSHSEVEACLVAAFARAFAISFGESALSAAELAASARLERERYGEEAWTRER